MGTGDLGFAPGGPVSSAEGGANAACVLFPLGETGDLFCGDNSGGTAEAKLFNLLVC